MNNNQQPNISPDFGYIMSQQAPPAKKSGPNKRIVIIVACLVLMVVMVLLNIFVKPSSKSKLSSTTGPAAQQVIAFNQALQAKDYQQAAEILRWQLNSDGQKNFANQLEESAKSIDYNTCKINSVEPKAETATILQTCSTIDGHNKWVFDFTVIKANDVYRVTHTTYKVESNV